MSKYKGIRVVDTVKLPIVITNNPAQVLPETKEEDKKKYKKKRRKKK